MSKDIWWKPQKIKTCCVMICNASKVIWKLQKWTNIVLNPTIICHIIKKFKIINNPYIKLTISKNFVRIYVVCICMYMCVYIYIYVNGDANAAKSLSLISNRVTLFYSHSKMDLHSYVQSKNCLRLINIWRRLKHKKNTAAVK